MHTPINLSLILLLANLSNCTFTLFRGIQLKTENAFM